MKNLSCLQRATGLQNPFSASGKRILRLQFWLVGYAVLPAFSSGARANDSAFLGVGGTPKLMKGEHASIAMQSEKIVIVAHKENYDTVVDFVFRNDGGATTVQMGFPEGSAYDVKSARKSTFSRFTTWVDGRKVAARRFITPMRQGVIQAYWLKTVRFGPKQTRRIRVSYSAPIIRAEHHSQALLYDFTGQNWKGKVERSDIEIRIQQPGLWFSSSSIDTKLVAMNLKVGPKNAVLRKTWRNWQAQGRFWFNLSRAVPYQMWDRFSENDGRPVDTRFFAAAKTFRIGPIPKDLPQDATNPSAFARNGVTYISLRHLKSRLGNFAYELQYHRKIALPKVALKWDAQTKVSTLVAGAKTLEFKAGKTHHDEVAPILLRGLGNESGRNQSMIYVPLAPVAKTLGLTFKLDPKNHLFDLSRGSWTGQ